MSERTKSRWLRRLLWLLVVVAALYTGAWFSGAHLLEQRLAASDSELVTACKERDTAGFPLSMAVTCESYELGGVIEIGPSVLSAPFTDLGRARVDFTAPMTLTPQNRSDGAVVAVSWTELNAQGEVGLGSRDLEDVSLAARDLIIRPGPHDLTIEALDALMSEGSAFGGVAQDAVFQADATGVQATLPYGLRLAPADLKLRATLRDGMARLKRAGYRWRTVLGEGGDLDIAQLAIAVPSGGRVVLSGPLTLANDGLLSGRVNVAIADGRALTEFASTLGPQAQQVVAGLVQAIAAAGRETVVDGETLRGIDVTIDRGNIRLGFFNLGAIPPLDL